MTEDKDRENPNLVTITKTEYESLLKDARLLAALERWGVDNWIGWDDARRTVMEWEAEEASK